MIQITKEFLKGHITRPADLKWWGKNCEGLPTEEQLIKLVNYRADCAQSLMIKLFNTKQKLEFAVFAAGLVLPFFEKEYPEDGRPRKAVELSRSLLLNNNYKDGNGAASYFGASAAAGAAAAAFVAYTDAAAAASYAADAASSAASVASVALVADAASAAAYYAVPADIAGAEAARKKLQVQLITYGINLLKKTEN